jgi:hypothetical protein
MENKNKIGCQAELIKAVMKIALKSTVLRKSPDDRDTRIVVNSGVRH